MDRYVLESRASWGGGGGQGVFVTPWKLCALVQQESDDCHSQSLGVTKQSAEQRNATH